MYTRSSVQVVLTWILLLIIFIYIPALTFSLSFNMSSIRNSDADRFNTTGDATVTNDGIQITRTHRDNGTDYRAGRATYLEPLHLWDKAATAASSGRNLTLTDFSTHFSFVIDSSGNTNFGDGLAFFLASPSFLGGSISNWSYGGGLGLGNRSASATPSSSAFVAVEFDTYINGLDPSFVPAPHVGIDINSMRSNRTINWNNDIRAGAENEAWVSYDASYKMLKVVFTGRSGGRTQLGSLSYEVDLRDYLPEYVTIGFSAATGADFQTNTVISWSFDTSLRYSNANMDYSNKKKAVVLMIAIGLPTLVLVLASAFSLYCLCKKKKKKYSKELGGSDRDFSNSLMDNEFERGATGPKRFSYRELALATNDFAEEAKLGQGGFGGVYKGLLRSSSSSSCDIINVAVKRVSKGSKQGRKEYASEVMIISRLRHMNLVQLIGWCHERGDLLLVYEFMPNGSLDSHLFKPKPPQLLLSWELRYKIARGLAAALFYLHEELKQYVVHRDLKASNVMLDSEFNAKLGDFGLARLVDEDKGGLKTTIPAGTLGYMAPEYHTTGRATKESDIYSFGVVLLEIACGRRPIEHRYPENEIVLVHWVRRLYEDGQLLDAADPKLDYSSSSYDDDAGKIEQLMVVGLWCTHPESSQRPSIRQAWLVLNSEAPLPTLPDRVMPPVPTYNTPPVTISSVSGIDNNTSNLTMPR